ncbi:hypothetical protein [Streptomyces sp. NBC_00091]|uniref:hypothetical protein n=1 Tax=Streptomyces sp. NBC_00091 TaxID=2975648 RepID=UPI00225786C1|nr:hypothetical protein [Streptomyces sp. NBC_00091]MCX5375678.1 hypothetical protein [Streptomyces sp. NBC_00091]
MDTTKTLAPTAPDADAAEDAAEDKAAAAEPTDVTEEPGESGEELAEDADDADEYADEDAPEQSTGVGAAASAVVAAGLGLVALSGSWVSRVAAERQTLIGQIESVNASTAKEKIAALYGDAWHTTALVNGVLSTLALLLAVFVLARPAFGAPGRVLPVWVRSVSWAAVALGLLGVLLFGLMYFDLLFPLPTAAQ